jgi:hypothetical protein
MQPSRNQQTQLIEKGLGQTQFICPGCSFPLRDLLTICPNCSGSTYPSASPANLNNNPPLSLGTRSYEPLSFESYDELFEEEDSSEETVELFDLHSQHFDEHLDKKVYEALSNQKISPPSLLPPAFIPPSILKIEPPILESLKEAPALKIDSEAPPPPALQNVSPLEHVTPERIKDILYQPQTKYLPLLEEQWEASPNTEALLPERVPSSQVSSKTAAEFLPVKVTPSLVPLKPMELKTLDTLETEILEEWEEFKEPEESSTNNALSVITENRSLSKQAGFSAPVFGTHALEPQKTLETLHYNSSGTIFFQQNVFTSGTSPSLATLTKEKNPLAFKDGPYINFIKQPLLVKALIGISWGGVLYGIYCILHQQMFQAFLLGQASILAFAAVKIFQYFKRLESQLTLSPKIHENITPKKNDSMVPVQESAPSIKEHPLENTQATGLQIKKQLPAINFLD